jgi:tRNA nucleotidyltransferase (CCA-adding enzyme)
MAAQQLWMDAPALVGANPSAVVDRMDGIPMLALHAVYIACEQAELRKLFINYISKWSKVSPTINGHDLRLRGMPPGPVYKHILKTLRDAWLDGEVSSKEQEEALLNRLIVTHNADD